MLRVGGAEPIFRDFSNRTKMKTKCICNQGITKQKGRYWYMAGRKNAKEYFKNPFHRPQNAKSSKMPSFYDIDGQSHSALLCVNFSSTCWPIARILRCKLTQNKDKHCLFSSKLTQNKDKEQLPVKTRIRSKPELSSCPHMRWSRTWVFEEQRPQCWFQIDPMYNLNCESDVS